MASSTDFVQYIADQCSGAGEIVTKKMFGDYGIYCDGKIFGLICDDCFYLKPTEAVRTLLRIVDMRPPYEGAKEYFYIESINYDNFHDMNIAIIYSESACRLSIQIPTYERLVDGSPYTSYSESYIDIDPRNRHYNSAIYEGSVSLNNGNYIEERPAVGNFSLPEDIANHYKNYGYELCGNHGEPGSFYKKEQAFTPERAQAFIHNIIQNSKYLPCLIATLFQKLGCTETCDASEIFRLIVSLLPQQFVTDFFGDEKTYQRFLMGLEPKNIGETLAILQEKTRLTSQKPDASTGKGTMKMNPINNGKKPNNP